MFALTKATSGLRSAAARRTALSVASVIANDLSRLNTSEINRPVSRVLSATRTHTISQQRESGWRGMALLTNLKLKILAREVHRDWVLGAVYSCPEQCQGFYCFCTGNLALNAGGRI